METTETETKKNSKSKKRKDEPVSAAKDEAPREIKLDRVDILSLSLITEKSRRLEAEKGRIEAEQNSLQNENMLYVQSLNEKYGVDMNGYSINLEAGIAKPRS